MNKHKQYCNRASGFDSVLTYLKSQRFSEVEYQTVSLYRAASGVTCKDVQLFIHSPISAYYQECDSFI